LTSLGHGSVKLWWEVPERIESDLSIVDYRESKLRWQPKIKDEFELNLDAVYSLRGPRQVGKTTVIKMIVKELLEGGRPPRAIFYYACDLVASAEELFQVIQQYQEFSQPHKFERRYVFIIFPLVSIIFQSSSGHLSSAI